MDVIVGGEAHIFNSFECAMHALVRTCANCGCQIVGHGVETDDAFYCCAHVAGVAGISDRA